MTAPPTRAYGDTFLQVPAVGLGAGHLGDPGLDEREVERLLLGAVDAGVTLVDTAPSYGLSEERIGRILAPHRQRVQLSTKVGYGVPGVPDWTRRSVEVGIDRALERLRTDVLDVVHLHSCPVELLERGGVVEPLARAVEAGKVRVAAYSGDNEPLDRAIADARLGGIQTSLSPWDQSLVGDRLARCRAAGLGVLVKRPLANAPWRFDDRPEAGDLAEYWRRFHTLELDPRGLGWAELALRFAAHQPGVSAVLVGTRRPEHIETAVAAVAAGPLDDDLDASIRQAWRRHGHAWRGVV